MTDGDGSVVCSYSAVKGHSLGDIRIAFLQFSDETDRRRVRHEITCLQWHPDGFGLALTSAAFRNSSADLPEIRSNLAEDWAQLRAVLPEAKTRYLPEEGLTGLLRLEGLGLGDDEIEAEAIATARVVLRGPRRFFGGVSGFARVCVGWRSRTGQRLSGA